MAEEDLKKLKRSDLLNRLLIATRENERLKVELAEARVKLADRQLDMLDTGSIAEASLKLNGVFEAAQEAANQYLDNIERLYRGRGELVREAQSKAQALVAQAKLDAQGEVDQVRADAETEAEQLRNAARAAVEEARNQARRSQEEANEAKRAAIRARDEATSIVNQAKEEALEIVESAQAEAQRKAEAILADARLKARMRMDEAERVSRNFEMATKVKCDNTMRRAMDEAHTYGNTMRMAMHVMGITPDMVPALEQATGMKATDPVPSSQPAREDAPIVETPEEAAEEEAPAKPDVAAELDRAVNSARAAVAAAISNAKTAPGTLDDETVAAMYPNSAEQL